MLLVSFLTLLLLLHTAWTSLAEDSQFEAIDSKFDSNVDSNLDSNFDSHFDSYVNSNLDSNLDSNLGSSVDDSIMFHVEEISGGDVSKIFDEAEEEQGQEESSEEEEAEEEEGEGETLLFESHQSDFFGSTNDESVNLTSVSPGIDENIVTDDNDDHAESQFEQFFDSSFDVGDVLGEEASNVNVTVDDFLQSGENSFSDEDFDSIMMMIMKMNSSSILNDAEEDEDAWVSEDELELSAWSSGTPDASKDEGSACPLVRIAQKWALLATSTDEIGFRSLYSSKAVRVAQGHVAGACSSSLSLNPQTSRCVQGWQRLEIKISSVLDLTARASRRRAMSDPLAAVRFTLYYGAKHSRGFLVWRLSSACHIESESQWIDGRPSATPDDSESGAFEQLVLDSRSCASRPSSRELRRVIGGRRRAGGFAFAASILDHQEEMELAEQQKSDLHEQEAEALDSSESSIFSEVSVNSKLLMPGERSSALTLGMAADVGLSHEGTNEEESGEVGEGGGDDVGCPGAERLRNGPMISASFSTAQDPVTLALLPPNDWCDSVSGVAVAVKFRALYEYCNRDSEPGLSVQGHGHGLLEEQLVDAETAQEAITKLLNEAGDGLGDAVLQRWTLRGDTDIAADIAGGLHGSVRLRMDLYRMGLGGSAVTAGHDNGPLAESQETDERIGQVVCKLVGRRQFDREIGAFFRAMEARCEFEFDAKAALRSPLSELTDVAPALLSNLTLLGCPESNRLFALELDFFSPPNRLGDGRNLTRVSEQEARISLDKTHTEEILRYDADGEGGAPPMLMAVSSTMQVRERVWPVATSTRRRRPDDEENNAAEAGTVPPLDLQARSMFSMGLDRSSWLQKDGVAGRWSLVLGAQEPLMHIREHNDTRKSLSLPARCLMPAVVSIERVSLIGAPLALGVCPRSARHPAASAPEWRLVPLEIGVVLLVHDKSGHCLTTEHVNGSLRFWPCGEIGEEHDHGVLRWFLDPAEARDPRGRLLRQLHASKDAAGGSNSLDDNHCLHADASSAWIDDCSLETALRFHLDPAEDSDATSSDQIAAQCWGNCVDDCISEKDQFSSAKKREVRSNRLHCGIECVSFCSNSNQTQALDMRQELRAPSVSDCYFQCTDRDCSAQTDQILYDQCQKQCATLCS